MSTVSLNATDQAPPRTTHDAAASTPGTLDALHRMTFDDLASLYGQAAAPASISALDGEPRGRMLALRSTGHGPVASAIRGFAASRVFPWQGKNFRSLDAQRGEGVNRIHILGMYRPKWFRFETSFEPSLADDRPCLRLNYNLPENPPGIRQITDELREVAPGLYMGPMHVVVGSLQPVTGLYFAVSFQ